MINPSSSRSAMAEVLLDWRSMSSLFATLMLITSLIQTYVPFELRVLLRRLFLRVFARVKPSATVLIDEYDPLTGSNDLYDAAQLYLGAHCLADSPSVRLFRPRNTSSSAAAVVASLPDSHTVNDVFHGVPMKWNSLRAEQSSNSGGGRNTYHHLYPYSGGGGGGGGRGAGGAERRSLELVFHPQHKDLVHKLYIPHVIEEAGRLRSKARERKLYTNRPYARDDGHRLWSSHTFSHPSNFETLAIDPELREEIRGDLMRFIGRKEHYSRVGRAWKRGYLLHGPPGTGKTSLVAAIANLLQFDVYDLELTTVPSNTQLRRLLISTTPKSVVVIEDIDCSLDLTDRTKNPSQNENHEKSVNKSGNNLFHETISLSGVLNFTDGLWSSCVGERLMVFTTNHPERLDPALLRPGRMDKKIELGYLNKAAFRILARNYLCIEDCKMDGYKKVMAEIESLLDEVKVTPAEVAEVFMACDGDSPDAALQKLVAELHEKKSAPLLKQMPPEESNSAASSASELPGCS